MAKVEWGKQTDRTYEYGVDRGVLYVDGGSGVPWNGLIRVDETVTGGEVSPIWMDGVLKGYRQAKELYQGSVSAITYPDEFEECDGILEDDGFLYSQQQRKPFCLTYRTKVANPMNEKLGYKLHLIFDAIVSPTQRQNASTSTTVNPLAFTWPINAIPQMFPNRRPTAHLILDSRKMDLGILEEIEDILYGTSDTQPRFPSASELADLQLLRGYQFALVGGKPMLVPGYPAEVIGNPDIGVYRTTRHSPLTPVGGKPSIYGLEL